jgi:hypothetical protein
MGVEHAVTRPAMIAPCGRRMPNNTTAASQARPACVTKVPSEMLPLLVATSTPPKPATAADRAKMASFVRGMEMPEVAAADSLLRTAVMARPVDDFCRLVMSQVIAASTIIKKTIIVGRFLKSSGPMTGLVMRHPL